MLPDGLPSIEWPKLDIPAPVCDHCGVEWSFEHSCAGLQAALLRGDRRRVAEINRLNRENDRLRSWLAFRDAGMARGLSLDSGELWEAWRASEGLQFQDTETADQRVARCEREYRLAAGAQAPINRNRSRLGLGRDGGRDSWFIRSAYQAVGSGGLGETPRLNSFLVRLAHRRGLLRRAVFKVDISNGGEVVHIRREDTPSEDRRREAVGRRGKVVGFSDDSRARFKAALGAIKNFWKLRGVFITLTYPAAFPTPDVAKQHLRAFLKRLFRVHTAACVFWRLEAQDRGAAHFHLLVLGANEEKTASGKVRAYVDYQWVAQSWFEVVGSGDPDHLKAGTETRAVKTGKQLQAYISKYLAKTSQIWIEPISIIDEKTGEITDKTAGRVWGCEGDRTPYLAPVVSVVLDGQQVERLARLAYGRAKVGLRRWVARSYTPEIRKQRLRSAAWILINIRRVIHKRVTCWQMALGDMLRQIGGVVGDGSMFTADFIQGVVNQQL